MTSQTTRIERGVAVPPVWRWVPDDVARRRPRETKYDRRSTAIWDSDPRIERSI